MNISLLVAREKCATDSVQLGVTRRSKYKYKKSKLEKSERFSFLEDQYISCREFLAEGSATPSSIVYEVGNVLLSFVFDDGIGASPPAGVYRSFQVRKKYCNFNERERERRREKAEDSAVENVVFNRLYRRPT